MSVTLKQINGGLVTPADDARLYELLSGGSVGIVTGCEVTHLGANQLQIAAGWGICLGRCFVIEQETINAAVSASGTVAGRLMLRIDTLGDVSTEFVTEAQASLADPVQEEINYSGSVYELPLAEYQVSEVLISDLVDVAARAYAPNHLYTCTLLASGWSGSASAGYTQTVDCVGMRADYMVSAPQVTTTGVKATDAALKEGLDALCEAGNSGKTLDGQIQWTCYSTPPTVDLPVTFVRVTES